MASIFENTVIMDNVEADSREEAIENFVDGKDDWIVVNFSLADKSDQNGRIIVDRSIN